MTPTEAEIIATVRQWRAELEAQFDSPAGQQAVEAFFVAELARSGSDKVEIVELARAGLAPADRALRRCIDEAMKANRFEELAVSVRYYAMLLLRAGAGRLA